MAKVTIEGHTFEGNVEELMELFAKMGAKFPIEQAQETITHEGVEYKRVDREAREGDVVVFTESNSEYFTNGNIYGPVVSVVDVEVMDNDGDYMSVYVGHMGRQKSNTIVYEPIVAKPAPLQVGDYAKVVREVNVHEFSVGDIVELVGDGFRPEFMALRVGDNEEWYVSEEEIVRATDEEVAEAKRQAAEKEVADKWAKIGRKPNEFKEGDIVCGERATSPTNEKVVGELEDLGYEHERCHGVRTLVNEMYFAVPKDSVVLITPVEHRFDKPAGDSE